MQDIRLLNVSQIICSFLYNLHRIRPASRKKENEVFNEHVNRDVTTLRPELDKVSRKEEYTSYRSDVKLQ